jgi:hypothetical protein
MGKLRIKTEFAQTPNKLLKNKEVSLKAKGLYAFIQSKSNGWEFSAQRISMELKEGLQSINSTLQELEEIKYLQRHKYQNNKGHWKIDYELHIEPYIKTLCTETHTQENPSSDNPVIGKHPNKERKNLERKNILNKEKETIKGVFDFYNLEKGKLPEALKLNKARGKLIKCRLEEYDLKTLEDVILKARDNKFINGTKTDFRGSIDWIFNKANFLKILEGNYENEKTNFGKEKPAFKLKTNRPT